MARAGESGQKISDFNYLIEMSDKRPTIFHINMLKRYYSRGDTSNNISEIVESSLPFYCPKQEDSEELNLFKEIELGVNLDIQLQKELFNIINKYSDVFSNQPGLTHLVTADIELTSELPIKSRPYKASPRQTALINKEAD